MKNTKYKKQNNSIFEQEDSENCTVNKCIWKQLEVISYSDHSLRFQLNLKITSNTRQQQLDSVVSCPQLMLVLACYCLKYTSLNSKNKNEKYKKRFRKMSPSYLTIKLNSS